MTSLDTCFVVGPTGSGKSHIALELARRFDGEIVNADAYQVYQDIPIITAAPSAEEQGQVAHHLYGAVLLTEDYSVARFAREATAVIAEIQSRGKTPIVVGGNGLYVKALTHGLSDAPPGDPALRQALGKLAPSEAVQWLEQIDPEGARAMNLQNPRYVMRALEISLLAGVPASVFKASWQASGPKELVGVFVDWEREILYQRINERVHHMITSGALDEIAALPSGLSATASKAIGIRDLQAYLNGSTTLEEAISAIQQASRRYAKRQGTWFRKETIFQRTTFEEAVDVMASIRNRSSKSGE